MESAALLPGSKSIKNASVDIRKGFVRKVYGILTVQLILTFLIAAPIVKNSQGTDIREWQRQHGWLVGVSFAGTVVCMCATCFCMKRLRTFPTNYAFLFLLTTAESLMVGYMSALYTWQSVLLALGLTVGIFATMTIFAWVTNVDFTGYGLYLLAGLCVLSVFGFALWVLSLCGVPIKFAMMFYNFCGVFLFTFYIVYDTQMILGEWGGHKHQFGVDDYCFAALNLYLDVVQLFINLLQLLGDRR